MPAAAYAWLAVTPEATVPSPKLHAYDVIEPSASDDAAPLTDTLSPVTAELKAAVGARFEGRPSRPTVWWFAIWVLDSAVA